MSHVPGVLLAKALGIKPYENDASLQKYNSMFIIALCWIVFITTVFRVFGDTKFKFLTLLIFITSPIIGSLGSAHWNTTPALLIYFLILSFILDIVYGEKVSTKRLLVLGVLIGSTFVVRPTCLAAIVPVGILIYRFQKTSLAQSDCCYCNHDPILAGCLQDPRTAPPSLVIFTLTITIFIHPSPRYWQVFYSAQRGVFCFCASLYFGNTWLFRVSKNPKNTKDKWVGLALLAWIIIHWCGVVAFALKKGAWWGGWCFGPRLLAETVPLWFFLACITQRYFCSLISRFCYVGSS